MDFIKKRSIVITIIFAVLALGLLKIVFFIKTYNYNYGYSEKLIKAIKSNDDTKVNNILRTPGNINSLPTMETIFTKGIINDPPITEACVVGNINIIRLLLEHGAAVNIKDNQKSWSPLEIACTVYHPNREEILKLLLEHGANINVDDGNGNTPILKSIIGGCEDTSGYKSKERELVMFNSFKLLEQSGGNIYGMDYQKRDALILACISDNTLIANYLVNERNFDVNKQDIYGQTPLIHACNSGTETAQFLIEHGADKNIKDSYGKSAFDYAKEKNNKKLMDLLSS